MEQKSSLNLIQVICKICKILCIIGFVFSIIGTVGCALGIVSLEAVGDTTITIGGVNIVSWVFKEANVTTSQAYAELAAGLIHCAGLIALTKLAQLYFEHELKAGTPFTKEGVKELFRLGLVTLIVGVVTSSVTGAVFAVMKMFWDDIVVPKGNDNYIWTGLILLFIGLIIKAALEQMEKPNHESENGSMD